MSNTLARPEPLSTNAVPRRGFYEKAVLGALSRMTEGCLHLVLPDGSRRTIGDPGSGTHAHLHILRPSFYASCLLYGDVGFGETYVDGDWDTDSIERLISWAILNTENCSALADSKVAQPLFSLLRFTNRIQHLLRPNSLETSRLNIAEHYDLGNDFYHLWLDPTMTYSSALFSSPNQSLEAAQIAKYDALCKKMHLHPGDEILEIGTGWGGFSRHAATHYGCKITTVTISQRQYEYAAALFQREGLGDRVNVQLQDYRLIGGKFDKIVSIEMLEAVGEKYLDTYFAKCHDLLRPHGLLALQYITVPDNRHQQLRKGVDWIQKHIFPGSLLLSVGRVNQALNATGDLFMHHMEDLGFSYAQTLNLWWQTFNRRIDEVRGLGFDERFIRKWNYYLQYCEAAFATRNISVVQAIYTRPNNRSLHRL